MKRSYLPRIVGYCDRPRLSGLLNEGLSYPLITVVAGPGYGKTTAVSGFMRDADVRLIWMRATVEDSDPERFWRSFTVAMGREIPLLAKRVESLGFPGTVSEFDMFSRPFIEAVGDGERVVVVIDEYENIQHSEVASFFRNILELDVDNLTLLFICNEKTTLGRINSSRGVFRMQEEDLLFTEEDIASLMVGYGLTSTAEKVVDILEETGGWPIAVQLLSRGFERGDGRLSPRSHIHLAAELFEQNFFSGYPEYYRNLLVALSLLTRFPLSLIRPLVGKKAKEVSGMLMSSPFVTYDYSAELYVFQKMYREFLARKSALLSREERDKLYSEAGHCFLDKGMIYDAMDCYWNCKNYEMFLVSVSRMPRSKGGTNWTDMVLERLNQIPKEYRESAPFIDFARAFMLMNGMKINRACDLFLDVAKRLESDPDEANRQMLGDAYIALSGARLVQCDLSALDYMKKAVELIPEGSTVRGKELYFVGNSTTFFLPDNEPGRVGFMIDYMNEYASYADTVSNGSGYGLELLFAAEANFFIGEADKARSLAYRAMEKAAVFDQHDIICNSIWLLMRIAFFFGDYERASGKLDELFRYIDDHRLQLIELIELRDCAASWYHLRLGGKENAAPWIADKEVLSKTLPLNVGKNRLLVSMYLSEIGENDKSYAVLSQLEDLIRERGLWEERVLLYTLKAEQLLQVGERELAIREFKRAYDMVYSNNIRVIFIEFGRSMVRLVNAVKSCEEQGFDLDWLNAVAVDAASYAKRTASMARHYGVDNKIADLDDIVLTEREIETIRYMSQGLTREEIAKMMGVGVNAVKKHVTKIYNKLGALNQADAIHIATTRGIIE